MTVTKIQSNFNKVKEMCQKMQCVIKKTIVSSNKYKLLDILGANEINVCIGSLETLFLDINKLLYNVENNKVSLSEAEAKINDIKAELIIVMKNFGTEDLEDMINIVFGYDYLEKYINSEMLLEKYNLLKELIHPINYKILYWKADTENINKKPIQKNKLVEDNMICESAENLDCFDLARTSQAFQTKVYGIKLCLHDYENKKTYLVACIVDDVLVSCIKSNYIENFLLNLKSKCPKDKDFIQEQWSRFINSLTIKDMIVYSVSEIIQRYHCTINQLALIKQKTISQVVKEFLNNELYAQRTQLIQLLIRGNEKDFQYLAYLLYDLLTNENNGAVDTIEQTLLYDSLPWSIKKYFRSAMKQTIQYTNTLYSYDSQKIPLEQQICLLKANDSVKEKAIVKLKELKAKSEDSGSKARQYLDALLKIPFSIYKEEPILSIVNQNYTLFKNIKAQLLNCNIQLSDLNIIDKNKYTCKELLNNVKIISDCNNLYNNSSTELLNIINKFKRDDIVQLASYINSSILAGNLDDEKIICSGRKILDIKNRISDFISKYINNTSILTNIWGKISNLSGVSVPNFNNQAIIKELEEIKNNVGSITNYMTNVTTVLDKAVHGHDKAKRQVERIIGQWINGEKSGYCFGFEGPPGVGKTSLAKHGLANCLKDEDDKARPFSFIAIGGSANGSTLEGHNYTYVGSTWGRIVDILIESKCMNPIIFIDELDKVSRTEHGKELIGILTHLIDPTQNDAFQDKYFSGIDLDLSKALFIFSYNDVDSIDKILLDRIHRIKFKHLALEEKLVITNNYILPEIYNKMGLDGIINIENSVIEYIIQNYTKEPGVRKLKELLFEIIGEINLAQLSGKLDEITYPINISIEDIRYKYLRERHEYKIKQIFNEHRVGVISGLWANNYGQGGLLPIESKFLPSSTFLDLKLTGMQGDVMKESMNVARTLAWTLLPDNQKTLLLENFEKTKCQGIHIHVPEGATPKDGPSGGAAITTVIYSLLANRKINRNFAMTGEICLQGRITAIGGLDLKILGGIESGITNFIYPKENDKDFKEFEENLKNKSIITNINFYSVNTIKEVFDLIFIDT